MLTWIILRAGMVSLLLLFAGELLWIRMDRVCDMPPEHFFANGLELVRFLQ
jgi:hypothetical protein